MVDLPATTRKRPNPGRNRRVAGWLLLVLGVLITGVWGASRWCTFGWSGEQADIRLLHGVMLFNAQSGSAWSPVGWYVWPKHAAEEIGLDWLIEEPALPWNSRQFINWHLASYERRDVISSGFSNSGQVIGAEHRICVGLWPFALASLLGGGWLVWAGCRARRRAMTGVCLKCGYGLVGLGRGVFVRSVGTGRR